MFRFSGKFCTEDMECVGGGGVTRLGPVKGSLCLLGLLPAHLPDEEMAGDKHGRKRQSAAEKLSRVSF